MKKNLIISSLVALLSISTIAGCGNNNVNTSSSSSSVSISEEDKFDKMLENLRKGVKFIGTLNQQVAFLDSDMGVPTGKKVENDLHVELNYSSKDENGYSAYVTRYDEVEEEDVEIINTSVFEKIKPEI